MRVYIPSTVPAVARLLADGVTDPPSGQGYAVTPALREWYASGDTEELEYAAMTHAARASLRLLAAQPDAPRRRVVLAAEVADARLSFQPGDEDPAVVLVAGPVALRDVAAGHVDEPGAAAQVAAAAAALPALDADDGDSDARFAVDSAEGNELGWYATQELAYLSQAPR